jgi:hypothetical protein
MVDMSPWLGRIIATIEIKATAKAKRIRVLLKNPPTRMAKPSKISDTGKILSKIDPY